MLARLWKSLGVSCGLAVSLAGAPAQAQTDKPGWQLTFDDEFDGPVIDTSHWQKRYKWGEAQINGELQAYVDDAFQSTGSSLRIVGERRTGQYAGRTFDYRSGMLASIFHQRFGWFEIRCKMPPGQGLWPAFWLLGESGTTGVNEIDIHEWLGHELTTVHMTVHWGESYTTGHQSDGRAYAGPDFSADFHTFAVDWDSDRIIWYVDGVERFRHTGTGVPQVEMYIITNLAIGGNWPGAPDSTTPFPAYYDVDYIRAYQKSAGGQGGQGGGPGASGASPTGGTAQSGAAGASGGSSVPEDCTCRVPIRSPLRPSGVLGGILAVMLLAVRRRARHEYDPSVRHHSAPRRRGRVKRRKMA